VASAEAGPTRVSDAVREGAGRLAGPAIAFAVALARILLGKDMDQSYVVPILFAAVVAGAALGGRWSALATVVIAAVGLAVEPLRWATTRVVLEPQAPSGTLRADLLG
jgi:K+-sensing histidine kinase KdpD